jgi:hypothetical protein
MKPDTYEAKFVTTEAIILGLILGPLIMALSIYTWINGEHLVHDAINETLWVAIYLTMVVAYCDFKMPTFFASSHPRLAVFCLAFLCGHVSMFFDSFAVVLLLTTITLAPLPTGTRYKFKFNAFAIKTICAFNALTVGGAFYIGELWGLPYFISSGMDNPLAGLPLLVVVTPYCILTSILAARLFPVKIEPVSFTKDQWVATIEIVFFLTLIIVTHRPFLCLGALMFYSAMRGRTVYMVKQVLHEMEHGALTALGLILAALLIQQFPGTKEIFAKVMDGPMIMLCASVSSPLAGAMTPGAAGDLSVFYQNLSWIMLGAPALVSSSLVAIVVFRETLDYEDLPLALQLFAKKEKGVMQEALAYSVLAIPMAAILGLLLLAANYQDIFADLYRMMS